MGENISLINIVATTISVFAAFVTGGVVIHHYLPKPTPRPVTEFLASKTTVEGGDLSQPIRYRLAYKKTRGDCIVSHRSWLLQDSTGATYALDSSKGRSGGGNGPTSPEVEADYQTQLLTLNSEHVALGPASITGLVTYDCRDGHFPYEYPRKTITITHVPKGHH